MRLKGLFWILTTLLLTILAVVTYYVFYTSSIRMFFAVEALVLLTMSVCTSGSKTISWTCWSTSLRWE